MKLRNRKLVEKDDGATPSQQNSVDKTHQNLDEDITIVSICEDNGDIEIISSKGNENSGQRKRTTDDDLILVEEISCSSQAESNPRKRKIIDDEDVKVIDEVEREVIFVEEVKKSRILCDEIVIADTQIQDTGRDTAEDSPVKQTSSSNTPSTSGPPVAVQPRRLFINPQHAASDIVEKLLQLGDQRVIQDELGPISPQEYNMLMGVNIHWRAANVRKNVADNETNQEFCWRVRRFTKHALLNVARQMSHHSSLAWAIVTNNREHTIQFLNKKQANERPVAFQAKNETQDPSYVKADVSQQNQSEPVLLPDINKVKKEKEEKES